MNKYPTYAQEYINDVEKTFGKLSAADKDKHKKLFDDHASKFFFSVMRNRDKVLSGRKVKE